MRVTRVILAEDFRDSKVIVDDSFVLDGVRGIKISHKNNEIPTLTLNIELFDVEIEQVVSNPSLDN